MLGRDIRIDIAKGISIILVAFSHSELRGYFENVNQLLALFRMPLFFFLSGIFFNTASGLKNCIIQKTDALLKPYFFTLIVLMILTTFLRNRDVVGEFYGILYGTGNGLRWVQLWFLPHLWILCIVSCLFIGITDIQQKSLILKVFTILILLTLGYIFMEFAKELPYETPNSHTGYFGLPFSFDIILISMAFFLSGFLLKNHTRAFKPNFLIFLSAILCIFLISEFSNASVNLNSRRYSDPIFATIAAFCGIYITLSISDYCSKSLLPSKILSTVGAASLFVLIFHLFIEKKSHFYLTSTLENYNIIFLSFIALLLSVAIPLVIKQLVETHNFFKLFYFPLKSNQLFQNTLVHLSTRKTDK